MDHLVYLEISRQLVYAAEKVLVSNLEEKCEDILDENICVGQLVGNHQAWRRKYQIS